MAGPRWAVNGRWLPDAFHLDLLLQRPLSEMKDALEASVTEAHAEGPLIAPIEDTQEVWAAGVTYVRSRGARVAESSTADLYQMVGWLNRELTFPEGAFLMTGTGLVPLGEFSLAAGDTVQIDVGDLTLENRVG